MKNGLIAQHMSQSAPHGNHTHILLLPSFFHAFFCPESLQIPPALHISSAVLRIRPRPPPLLTALALEVSQFWRGRL